MPTFFPQEFIKRGQAVAIMEKNGNGPVLLQPLVKGVSTFHWDIRKCQGVMIIGEYTNNVYGRVLG
ncbi:hypothetical protein GHA01_28620 [Novacetimonas hansenii]|uniref:Uncharacterized protein n=1 Tax=Novacetimonas hansenii TaxID=436 RepID=A0ABQ0SIC2_NOVHA|nr:hypothetical protein Gaha_0248_003 [Novacetimonas hansenii JCM 7643]GEC65013.1 hypothetical protein GHA01_28620 [Novacetimonas hansenii]